MARPPRPRLSPAHALPLGAALAASLVFALPPAAAAPAASSLPAPVPPAAPEATEPAAAEARPARPAAVRAARPKAATRAQPAFLAARPAGRDPLELRARPGGRVVASLPRTTEFGSPRVLSVVERRGGWIGVTTPELPNGVLGWLRATDVELEPVAFSVVVDLSERTLAVRRGERVVRRVTVGVGAVGSPTPTGRFAVTDKLAGGDYGPYYGCCILALSGRQPNLPVGWTGGDRIAIHGTSDPGSVGAARSAGCLRAGGADLRALMRQLPLGTPVLIRA
ncbi:MAG: L,D-transpeptidase [Thermoleophilia bacterium]|nr:L,D-transpeptidase [Thermoleophilia bacterium]